METVKGSNMAQLKTVKSAPVITRGGNTRMICVKAIELSANDVPEAVPSIRMRQCGPFTIKMSMWLSFAIANGYGCISGQGCVFDADLDLVPKIFR